MRKLALLAALASLGTGISEARPPQTAAPSATTRSAEQEGQLTPMKKVGLLSLSYRRQLDLSPQLARSIEVIDLISGKARLSDGRCFSLNPTSGRSSGVNLSSDQSACAHLVKYPLLVSGRCSADQGNVSIGTWRVGCRAIDKRRSVIVATKKDDPSWTLELASLPGEQLIAVSVIGLHDQGVVMAVGIGPDGTVALSHYLWFDGPYRKLAKPG